MTNEQYREFLFQAEQARNAHLRRTFARAVAAVASLLAFRRTARVA